MEMYEGCAVLARRALGTSIVRLVNEFAASPDGASYVTTMTIGDDNALGKIVLHKVAHRKALPPHRTGPWILHHVEEIGSLEHFLPDLFADRSPFEP